MKDYEECHLTNRRLFLSLVLLRKSQLMDATMDSFFRPQFPDHSNNAQSLRVNFINSVFAKDVNSISSKNTRALAEISLRVSDLETSHIETRLFR